MPKITNEGESPLAYSGPDFQAFTIEVGATHTVTDEALAILKANDSFQEQMQLRTIRVSGGSKAVEPEADDDDKKPAAVKTAKPAAVDTAKADADAELQKALESK